MNFEFHLHIHIYIFLILLSWWFILPRLRAATNLINLRIRVPSATIIYFDENIRSIHRATSCHLAKVAYHCLSFTKEQWMAGRKVYRIPSSSRRNEKGTELSWTVGRTDSFSSRFFFYSVGRRHRGVWFIRAWSTEGPTFFLLFVRTSPSDSARNRSIPSIVSFGVLVNNARTISRRGSRRGSRRRKEVAGR